jgi:hypothetical protein
MVAIAVETDGKALESSSQATSRSQIAFGAALVQENMDIARSRQREKSLSL